MNLQRGRKSILLARWQPVADAIATLFFPYVEVVIHDLRTQTIAYLANNLSKREVGADSALDEIGFDPAETVLGPYEKLNWDGRKIRSISIVAREADEPIGLICLNVNISVFEQAKAALELFLSAGRLISQPDKLFRNDWQERINAFLQNWLQKNHLSLSTLNRDHKRELVEALHSEGAFNGRGAANYVANVLGIGRATVFKHLKELRGRPAQGTKPK